MLSRLDVVVGAVHTNFGLSRQRQTERILRAMDHRYFNILAHPTGRELGARTPYQLDMARVLAHAKQRGCFLELNARPARLDLNDTDCMLTTRHGVLVSINSDAHSMLDLDYVQFGIAQARRGTLEACDVLNTRPLADLRQLLARAS